MLKVSSPQPQEPPIPPIDNNSMPPVGDGLGMDGANDDFNSQEMSMMDDEMGNDPMQSDIVNGNGEEESEFDTNFDAGVDADEDTDPKKYIQQLTGKLSQSLRKYNNGLPQADADTNKYVANMIIKQAVDGLSQDDINDILDNLNDDEQTNESVKYNKRKKQLDEIFQDVISQDDEEAYLQPNTDRYNRYSKKPFSSPDFH